MTTEVDRRHMAHALALGRRGLGRMQPYSWPSVGCVLVRDGRVVGRGRSDPNTTRHAERVALDMAGKAARGATAYVTLEPCSHHGNTPPCAEALIAAGVARVVIALQDPNPQVNGGGLERLRAAGIDVAAGVFEEDARKDHAGFLLRVAEGRPYLSLKLAASVDGRIATASGQSRWITGPGARRAVHAMRLSHDAVLVGGGTARADNPTLTVREMGAVKQPVRIVASRHLSLPWPNRLIETMDEGPVWLLHGAEEGDVPDAAKWSAAGARLFPVPVEGGQIAPRSMMRALGEAGLTRVFCEGGGAFAASLLQAGVVDELVTFQAGLALGAEGQPSLGALGVADLAEAPRFELADVREVAGDVLCRWRRKI